MTKHLLERPLIRGSLGVLLILHGFAHALPGMRTADTMSGWLAPVRGAGNALGFSGAMTLWSMATLGLVAAGLGALGVTGLRRYWTLIAASAALVSASFLAFFSPPFALIGSLLDVGIVLLCALLGSANEAMQPVHHRVLRRAATFVAVVFLAYTAVVVTMRPYYIAWGVTDEDIHAQLPGDIPGRSTYAVHHAVTIDAPAARVWPWLAQIGQDRGGFYSYSWLENLVGCRLRNADRVHPEWQGIATGDSIWATPPDYLGTGKRLGWLVTLSRPERALVLEKWGAFVLQPLPDGRTRLIVRTRGTDPARWYHIPIAPLGLMVFQPAHFIMERKMLLEIKKRVESGGQVQT